MADLSEQFSFDVFLSHSSKDKEVARDIAKRLRRDGFRVWFEEWEIRPGDNIPARVEDGLERSAVLVLCLSANAIGLEWTELEAGSFRFRDPLNERRRFVPVRFDDTPVKGSLAQFLPIDWRFANRGKEYRRLYEACRARRSSASQGDTGRGPVAGRAVRLMYERKISWYSFTSDGRRALTVPSSLDLDASRSVAQMWDLKTGTSLGIFKGHASGLVQVAWSPDNLYALSSSSDGTVQLWEVESGRRLRVFEGHTDSVLSVAWSPDGRRALSGSRDNNLRLWDIKSGRCICMLEGHTSSVWGVGFSLDGLSALSGAGDATIRLWEVESGRCLRVLKGHTEPIQSVGWSPDGQRALSGSHDKTVRLWEVESGRCMRVLEGHIGSVSSVAWSPDGRHALSGASDKTVRLWDLDSGRCLRILDGHTEDVCGLVWSADGRRAFSGNAEGWIRVWELEKFLNKARVSEMGLSVLPTGPKQVHYTNAKVLLVGESGAGKTGLSNRLASDVWEPSDSTVGAWATQWKLPVASSAGVEREIWLWDFGGQADQRLVHQLFMDETALAVLVFDGQKEDIFETLEQWDRDLDRASRKQFTKLLVAGRVDAGGLRTSRSEVETFAAARLFRGFLETSAKKNLGCDELKQAILAAIDWDELPCRTTAALFKRLKEEIILLKDEGRVLLRFNELRETLQLRLFDEFERFADEELRAVLTLLAGPGVVWELAFGSWVLLQPERINAYAQAVIRTVQCDDLQRGCLTEERVLKGDLIYESSMPRLVGDEERFVLLAMHQILVERGLCLRQPTSKGNLLVFPSYCTSSPCPVLPRPPDRLSGVAAPPEVVWGGDQLTS